MEDNFEYITENNNALKNKLIEKGYSTNQLLDKFGYFFEMCEDLRLSSLEGAELLYRLKVRKEGTNEDFVFMSNDETQPTKVLVDDRFNRRTFVFRGYGENRLLCNACNMDVKPLKEPILRHIRNNH